MNSFTIKLKDISVYQLDQLKNHISEAKILNLKKADQLNERDTWYLTFNDREVAGYPMAGNFDMSEFLKAIGVDLSKVSE